MQRTSRCHSPAQLLYIAASVVVLMAFTASSTVASCGADANEVDARCYNGNLQAAVGDALASDRPLLLPPGTYPISQTLVIDYATRADSGFRIISQGARIDGTAIGNGPVLQSFAPVDPGQVLEAAFTFTRREPYSLTPILAITPSGLVSTIFRTRTTLPNSII